MSTGTLRVKLSSARDALPVKGKVRISDSEGNLLYEEMIENEDGLSQEFILPAPNVSETFEPEAAEDPYAQYTIEATSPGFSTVTVKNAQIYSDINSLLEMNMLAVPDFSNDRVRAAGENDLVPQVYNIPPNSLRLSVENQTEYALGRLLTEVYIPEYITVHLGAPGTNAKNVSVSFPDYIKNVASSEIYPTWPDESLRANIYAQISLALNRVFTEWYRSRGYNYDITNSTAYDQYYVPGRNIFDNISDIVDEIFDSYLRRPGRVEPFYAEYCSGTNVTCPGMSQWGTVNLANAGYDALGILESYYGDLELVENVPVQAIEESYPGRALSVGSSGENVRIIQRQLNRIGNNYPSIPKVAEDGVFGSGTSSAVRAFQRAFSMPVDGIVGKQTWYRISYIYTAVKKLAELTSEGELPLYGQYEYPGTPLLEGSSGEQVRKIQFYLSLISRYDTSIPEISVDGIFGPGTKNAVVAFQRAYGLTPDGIVGPDTWNAIVRVYRGDEESNGLPLVPYPGSVLKIGSRGDNVRYVQNLLREIRKVFPQIPLVANDGIYGSNTARAVTAFQRIFGLTADGTVGPSTWSKMQSVYGGIRFDCFNDTFSNARAYPGSLQKVGSRGEDVRYIQSSLNIIRRLLSQIPLITADGVYGNGTAGAVRAFQSAVGLSSDGVVGRSTWNRLNNFRYAVDSGCLSPYVTAPAEEIDEVPVIGSPAEDNDEVPAISSRTEENPQSPPVTETIMTPAPPYPNRILSPGDRASEIIAVKRRLSEIYRGLWFFPTAIFGSSLHRAIMRFQRNRRLEPTGRIDKDTWEELFK